MVKILISSWKTSLYVHFLKHAVKKSSHFYPSASQLEERQKSHPIWFLTKQISRSIFSFMQLFVWSFEIIVHVTHKKIVHMFENKTFSKRQDMSIVYEYLWLHLLYSIYQLTLCYMWHKLTVFLIKTVYRSFFTKLKCETCV